MKWWVVMLVPVITACGPAVHLEKVDAATSADLNSSVKVLQSSSIPAGAKSLGEVQATSCKHMAWEPSPTNENAITQMKSVARKKGGNAITNVYCEPPLGTTLTPNCWSSIRCTATALLVSG